MARAFSCKIITIIPKIVHEKENIFELFWEEFIAAYETRTQVKTTTIVMLSC
jgi:hypothetical protein